MEKQTESLSIAHTHTHTMSQLFAMRGRKQKYSLLVVFTPVGIFRHETAGQMSKNIF